MPKKPLPTIDCHPVMPNRWVDFESLFGERGACAGCWCTFWRRPRSEFNRNKGAGNRRFIKDLVESGVSPGLVGYLDRDAVGWCAVAPRADYPSLGRSRILRPVDDVPVWSVSCLFVRKDRRRKGVSVQLLRAAVAYVKDQAGSMVEGYPVEPKSASAIPAAFAWTGLASAFLSAGFKECARRSETRPIMRCAIRTGRRHRSN